MYLPSKNGTVASIEREFHVVDDLTAKALIGIDIMKPEGIVLDLENDAMKTGSCQNLDIPTSSLREDLAPVLRSTAASE